MVLDSFCKEEIQNSKKLSIMRQLILSIILAFCTAFSSFAQNTDQKTVSLITSTPSDLAVFTVWGHTAIRIQDPSIGLDVMFNYGIFSFHKGFYYKFVKGETDYKLAIQSIPGTMEEVAEKNSYMYEQVLNLTKEEKEEIIQALYINVRPENRYYRYNFFYDNCATRPRELIEKVTGGLTYATIGNKMTYREIIHERLANMKWFALGIDLCLGSPTDNVVPDSDMTFLPVELMSVFESAKKTNGESIVKETKTLFTPIQKTEEKDLGSRVSPILACWIFLALIVAHTLFYNYKKKNDLWFDITLWAIAGLIGSVLFFLAFFSVHPSTNPNFNLLWLNPLQLLFAILAPFKALKEKLRYYQMANLSLILIAIIGWPILPQQFNPAVFPLMIALAIRALNYIMPFGELVKKYSKTKKL